MMMKVRRLHSPSRLHFSQFFDLCADIYTDQNHADCLAIYMATTTVLQVKARTTRQQPTTRSTRLGASTTSLTDLVEAILNGADVRWPQLLERLTGRVQATLRSFDVDSHLRNDAEAETWRTLFEKLHEVKDPEQLPSWISIVARNKMLDLIRRRQATVPSIDLGVVSELIGQVDPDLLVLAETKAALRRALGRLSPREQAVIADRLTTTSPDSLHETGKRLNMPVGSIGPTMGRGLTKLRRDPELSRFLVDYEYSTNSHSADSTSATV